MFSLTCSEALSLFRALNPLSNHCLPCRPVSWAQTAPLQNGRGYEGRYMPGAAGRSGGAEVPCFCPMRNARGGQAYGEVPPVVIPERWSRPSGLRHIVLGGGLKPTATGGREGVQETAILRVFPNPTQATCFARDGWPELLSKPPTCSIGTMSGQIWNPESGHDAMPRISEPSSGLLRGRAFICA